MNEQSVPRLTWLPPVGEGFVVSPSLAELEAAVLRHSEEFWSAGSCDGGLYLDVAGHATAELKLMFAAPDRFCVCYTDCVSNAEHVASVTPPSSENVCVRPGGNPWQLPRHYFVDRQTAWRAVESFCRGGQRSPEVRWIPFQPPDSEA